MEEYRDTEYSIDDYKTVDEEAKRQDYERNGNGVVWSDANGDFSDSESLESDWEDVYYERTRENWDILIQSLCVLYFIVYYLLLMFMVMKLNYEHIKVSV